MIFSGLLTALGAIVRGASVTTLALVFINSLQSDSATFLLRIITGISAKSTRRRAPGMSGGKRGPPTPPRDPSGRRE